MDKPKVLVFGVGNLQRSIIARAKELGYYVVGIDPLENAYVRQDCDAFEVVDGQDFEGTCNVVEKYGINGIVTTSTDKPLVMMARVAEKYRLPFFSVDTAIRSTDKFLMKQLFQENGIPCARGKVVKNVSETAGLELPLIIKPRDNSGSRGVKLCSSREDVEAAIKEALDVSRLDTVLAEEFIEGQEYSVEAIHHNGKTHIIQITEKTTTPFPYNVELGHLQPASISDADRININQIVGKIASAFGFDKCPSHTELKINERGIFIIETSPRLGGDFINSYLTPMSTGVNIEDLVLKMAMGTELSIPEPLERSAGIRFFMLPVGSVVKKSYPTDPLNFPGTFQYYFKLKEGDKVKPITSSLDRYAYVVYRGDDKEEVKTALDKYEHLITTTCI